MKKTLILTIIIATAVGVAVWYVMSGGELPLMGEPVMTPLADDLVVLEAPIPGSRINSPLTVKGMARGFWYFEASFPVQLKDGDGTVIATGIATAQREWMTEEFVPFIATLVFEKPATGERGTLVLHKDNPSGLPEHDDSREIPVHFE